MILKDRANIILLQVPLAKSICLSGTQFIIWKQEGLRARGHSLRMTIYMYHTGQCKGTGGCYNELVVAFLRTGDGLKGKKIYTC